MEKSYKTMGGAGSLNIILGIIGIVVGVAGGILLYEIFKQRTVKK